MKKILVQLDSDQKASVFDQIVAYDAGVDHLISIAPVTPEEVRDLVYGAMFTRGGKDLKNTAVFIGGSSVEAGERLFDEVGKTFFGPVRVSVMLDSNGSNTTAAAAVRKIAKATAVWGKRAFVLGGTGPVGLRAAALLVREGCQVGITSRSYARAEESCRKIKAGYGHGLNVQPYQVSNQEEMAAVLQEAEIVLSAGGAGVTLFPGKVWTELPKLQVMADVNAVPPLGIEGTEVADDGILRAGKLSFGAIAIGNLKMKVHREAIQRLFDQNDQILGIEEIYEIAKAY
jgi:hypothetical protein